MRSIKIKVKHIFLLVILILISFCFIVPISLLSYGKIVQEKSPDKAKAAYNSVVTFNPFNIGKDAALYRLASIILPDEFQRNRYTIFNTGMALNGQYINYEMVNRAEKYLKEIMDKKKHSKYYTDAYKKLFHSNIMCSRLDKAKDLVQEGLKSDNTEVKDISLRFSMLLSFIGKDYNRVINIGNEIIEENKADYDTYLLMGDGFYLENKFEQAEKYYTEAKKLSKNGLISNDKKWNFETDGDAYSSIGLVAKAKNLFTGNGEIKGKVEVNGKAVPFAYVYLSNNFHNKIRTTGMCRENIFTVTDLKGNYEFNNLPNGNYTLGIGIYSIYLTDSVYQSPKESYIYLKNDEVINYDFNFVPPLKIIEPIGVYEATEDKVDISWDNVKNAEYYNISIVVFEKPNKLEGSNARFVVENGIKETSHTLELEKINSGLYGFIASLEGESNSQAYLGSFYPGATVPIIIEAFDKNNNKLTSSAPVNVKYDNLSVIKIPDKNIKSSDKLLLEGSTDLAVIEYEKDLKNNPNDTHALLVLSKIYSLGTKIKQDNSGKEVAEGRNPERAFELASRLYNITGESEYQRNVLSRLALNSDRNINWILEKYKDMDDKSLEYIDFSSMGNLNLMLGNLRAAEENYDKIFYLLKDENYFDMRPVILKLYNKDYKTALRYLSKTDFSFYQFDKEAFEKDMLVVMGEAKDAKEYKKFEEALLTVLRSETTQGIKEKYQREYESISHTSFKNILRQVGDYYYLFE